MNHTFVVVLHHIFSKTHPPPLRLLHPHTPPGGTLYPPPPCIPPLPPPSRPVPPYYMEELLRQSLRRSSYYNRPSPQAGSPRYPALIVLRTICSASVGDFFPPPSLRYVYSADYCHSTSLECAKTLYIARVQVSPVGTRELQYIATIS